MREGFPSKRVKAPEHDHLVYGRFALILKNARVKNYRCIDDSGEFSIRDVTCFVGKNESGKTAILQALERLKPVVKDHDKFDKVNDYPRKWLSDYDERNPNGDPIAIETEWELEDDDVAAIEAIVGADALKSKIITATKGYGPSPSIGVNLKHEQIIRALAKENGCVKAEIDQIEKFTTPAQLADFVKGYIGEATPGIISLRTKLAKLRDSNYDLGLTDVLFARMPSFLYFSNYDRMSGRVSIDDLNERKRTSKPLTEGSKLFMEFLQFANITLDEIEDTKKAEDLRAKTEAASIKISKQIFEYWSQNRNLKVEFIVEAGRPDDDPPFNSGFIMQARVRNSLHDMTVPFSERSAGFVWFFSFLVRFSQVKKEFGNVIILLDEPGLALHARAQGDLLRYFNEKLKTNHQVLYTTHSPFMVPSDDLTSVRTVEDVVVDKDGVAESLGTHVGDDVLSTDRDTLFPLQAALGFEITQSLFVGEHTLLVEGPSDYLYFVVFSRMLKAAGRTSLDCRWTICPTGGVDKVPAFVSLFGGNKLDIAVVIDFVKGQKSKVDSIKQSKLLKDGRVITFADVLGQDEADVEDMLGAELFAGILTAAYSLKGKNVIDATKLGAGTKERVLPKAEDAFRVMPATVADFNHYDPSAYLAANEKDFAGNAGMNDSLNHFEDLFKIVNAMLA